MLTAELLPTRSSILQLREEHDVVLEAYDFLDEKRLLLAAELLRQLAEYEEIQRQFNAASEQATTALQAMVRHHGLQGSQVYPAIDDSALSVQTGTARLMGVTLLTAEMLVSDELQSRHVTPNPSRQAENCRQAFTQLLTLAAVLAAISGNLHRLLQEYRRTERRTKALENVVLPELEVVLKVMTTRVDDLDQEDIVRMHHKHDQNAGL